MALADAGELSEVREYGKIANTPAAAKALAAKLGRNGHALQFCYEAGPCGYGIQHDCFVVAPSRIPRRPSERIETDRRDAINPAKLHRAGELTSVWVPDQAYEATRDLVRVRRLCGRCVKPVSNCLAFCCAMAITTNVRRGRRCTANGWPACASSMRCITSCWKAALRLSRRRRHGAIVWKPTLKRHYRTGRSPRWCTPSRASPIHASSWPISVWCRPSTPASTRGARAV